MITYITGDLFNNLPNDKDILITHVCNDIPAWGSGFVVPLMAKWPQLKTHHYLRKSKLGETEFERVSDNIRVANMIAQKGVRGPQYARPLQDDSLVKCMETVALSLCLNEEIYAPKFGALRAGAKWEEIEVLINKIWISRGIKVTVFCYEE